jgi:hypothetical protein
MNFPFLRYLNQILFDENKPAIINPQRYWQIYSINHLEKCLNNKLLEHCWEIDYQQFVKRYRNFIEPHYLEENGSAFIEYCWKLNYRQYRRYSYRHPEEDVF